MQLINMLKVMPSCFSTTCRGYKEGGFRARVVRQCDKKQTALNLRNGSNGVDLESVSVVPLSYLF